MKRPDFPIEWIERSKNDTQVLIEFEVPRNLSYFEGHFFGFEILPGVVQIDWAMKFSETLLGVSPSNFSGFQSVKFVKPCLPGARVSLLLELSKEVLSYRYSGEKGDYSSGKVKLGGQK